MKILRNALDAKCACPLICKGRPKPSVFIQSPLAAYFDENCFNLLLKDSPAGVVLKDTALRFEESGLSTNCLPYKSPMTAYFDGNDCFGLEYDTCQDCSTQCQQHDDVTVCRNVNLQVGERQRRVRWADEEVDGRRQLKLAELVGTGVPNISGAAVGVWQMAQHKEGCREVQKALEECTDGWAIASELIGHVWEAIRCPHANHVLRKVIQTLSPTFSNFIVREIMQRGSAGVRDAASHRYGCRILEELLRVCDADQVHDMVECLIGEVEVLCTNMYGNFVVNTLLGHCSSTQYQRIVHVLAEHVVLVGTNFYGCAVLARALKSSNDERRSLTLALLSVSGLLSSMNSHKHGKAVVEALMGELQGEEYQAAILQLALPALKTAKSAKKAIQESHVSLR